MQRREKKKGIDGEKVSNRRRKAKKRNGKRKGEGKLEGNKRQDRGQSLDDTEQKEMRGGKRWDNVSQRRRKKYKEERRR